MTKTEKQYQRQFDSSIAVKSETVNALNAMNLDIPKGAIVEKLVNGLLLAYEKQIKVLLEKLNQNGKAHEIFKTQFMFEVDSQQRILVAPKLTAHKKAKKSIVARYSRKGQFKGIVK